jgi:multidrug efflux pump subunit AcrA (membrane-fusion protein)
LVHPGTSLLIRCRTCPAQTLQQTGTVTGISDAPLEVLQAAGSAPAYRVTVSLPPQPAQSHLGPLTQSGMSVEAEISLGRKPLIRWFFERSGS